jgi:hypothetical protein
MGKSAATEKLKQLEMPKALQNPHAATSSNEFENSSQKEETVMSQVMQDQNSSFNMDAHGVFKFISNAQHPRNPSDVSILIARLVAMIVKCNAEMRQIHEFHKAEISTLHCQLDEMIIAYEKRVDQHIMDKEYLQEKLEFLSEDHVLLQILMGDLVEKVGEEIFDELDDKEFEKSDDEASTF